MWKTILPIMEKHGLAWTCVSSMDMEGGADGMGGQLVETMTIIVYSTDDRPTACRTRTCFPPSTRRRSARSRPTTGATR